MYKMNSLFEENNWCPATKEQILEKVTCLLLMHKKGLLGGEFMPEDANPGLDKGCADNYHYFTLPMALNYQRNSYYLWPAANNAYNDEMSRKVFRPKEVIGISPVELKDILVSFKIALQPNKHVDIWRRICETICERYDGDIRNLFSETRGDVIQIKKIVQEERKKDFPYLSGNKICNYWLYVMSNYTSVKLCNRNCINVAPDTHVIQATFRLGILNPQEKDHSRLSELVDNTWFEILEDTGISPIDIHTPLWLWSRRGFPEIITPNK